jgi:hypothetical protein
MTVKVEQLPGEPIFVAIFSAPFDAQEDIRAMFGAFMPMRAGISGSLVLILDLSITASASHAFSQMVIGMGEAAAQIRVNRAAPQMSPPQLIFVGTSDTVPLAAEAMGQPQYSGIKAHACTRREEAITLARNLLAD